MVSNGFSKEERRSIAEFVYNLTVASRPLTYQRDSEFQHLSVEQIKTNPSYEEDEQYTMEQLSDELSVLERQKENTEREIMELRRRTKQSEIDHESLRSRIQIERDHDAIENVQNLEQTEPKKISDKNEKLSLEMQLVKTKLEVAESLEDKTKLSNENSKMRRKLEELEEVLGQTHEAIKNEKEKYSRTMSEIKRKIASEQAAIEDLTLEVQRAASEKEEFEKEFLDGIPRNRQKAFMTNPKDRQTHISQILSQKKKNAINGARSIKTMQNIAIHAESFITKALPTWTTVHGQPKDGQPKNGSVETTRREEHAVPRIKEKSSKVPEAYIPDDVLV